MTSDERNFVMIFKQNRLPPAHAHFSTKYRYDTHTRFYVYYNDMVFTLIKNKNMNVLLYELVNSEREQMRERERAKEMRLKNAIVFSDFHIKMSRFSRGIAIISYFKSHNHSIGTQYPLESNVGTLCENKPFFWLLFSIPQSCFFLWNFF